MGVKEVPLMVPQSILLHFLQFASSARRGPMQDLTISTKARAREEAKCSVFGLGLCLLLDRNLRNVLRLVLADEWSSAFDCTQHHGVEVVQEPPNLVLVSTGHLLRSSRFVVAPSFGVLFECEAVSEAPRVSSMMKALLGESLWFEYLLLAEFVPLPSWHLRHVASWGLVLQTFDDLENVGVASVAIWFAMRQVLVACAGL
mmetsp:Transcript_24234/g.68190  ORF Transcript_24234/g.68190 Transcript_24234/m.68190 type:complete len:201 (+) Transcript_24234:1724-2326(+)